MRCETKTETKAGGQRLNVYTATHKVGYVASPPASSSAMTRSSSLVTIKNRGVGPLECSTCLREDCIAARRINWAEFMRTEPLSNKRRASAEELCLPGAQSHVGDSSSKSDLHLKHQATIWQDIDEDQMLFPLTSSDESQPSVRVQECEADEGRLVDSRTS